MERIRRNILLVAIIILSVFLSMVSFVAAEPVVENITTDPKNPAPLSTITVTADIRGENISTVNLTISECDEIACYVYQIIQMSKTESGDWIVEAALQDGSGRSTHIKYRFDITDGGVLYQLTEDIWRVDLSTGNGDQNGDGSDGDDTPGFEIITLLAAIIIGILLLKQKRF
jgi:hypothetical protein